MEHITDTRIEQSEPTAVTLGNLMVCIRGIVR